MRWNDLSPNSLCLQAGAWAQHFISIQNQKLEHVGGVCVRWGDQKGEHHGTNPAVILNENIKHLISVLHAMDDYIQPNDVRRTQVINVIGGGHTTSIESMG